MKGLLEFNLADPYEQNAHKRAIHATDAYLVIHSLMYDTIRKMLKYEDLTEEQNAIVDRIQNDLHSYMFKYGIDLGDLE